MGTRPENLTAAERGILEGIRSFRSSQAPAEELARTIAALRGRALMRRMTRISLAYEAGLELVRGEAPGDQLRGIDTLTSVSAADVRRVAERYLDPDRLARVVVR
jgi:predicted Zn-dependent peptidase